MAAKGGRIDFMFLGPPPLPSRWIRYWVFILNTFVSEFWIMYIYNHDRATVSGVNLFINSQSKVDSYKGHLSSWCWQENMTPGSSSKIHAVHINIMKHSYRDILFMHLEGLKIGCVPYCEGSDDFILWEAELLRSTSKTKWWDVITLLCPYVMSRGT